MQDNGQLSDSHSATVEAFYARVMHRVCSSYQKESDGPTDEAITRLQQKWQEKLMLYTGKKTKIDAMAENNDVSVVEDSGVESSTESDSDSDGLSSSSSSSSMSSSGSSSKSEASSDQAVGRPSAQLPRAATSSMFAKMLGGKRKLCQLDGSASDAEDNVQWQEAADLRRRQELQRQSTGTVETLPTTLDDPFDEKEDNLENEVEDKVDAREEEAHRSTREEEGNAVDALEYDKELPPSPTSSATSTSLLVSSDDFSPVLGLSGINLPLQLAAEYSKFIYRGKRRGYTGQLHAIVLTWPIRLSARDAVRPGELVWCLSDSAPGFLVEGELVKMISVGDTRYELKVQLGNGDEVMVSMERVRRLSEYFIRHGSVRFHTEQ